MSQVYISRNSRGVLITCIAKEDGQDKMSIQLFGMKLRMKKNDFLKNWRPAICEERPTA